jgi:hypothetical protein
MIKRTNNKLTESMSMSITRAIDKIQLAEKLDANVVRGDNYNSIPDGIVAQAKEKVKKMKLTKGSEYEPAMTKVLSDMGWEITRSGKYVKEAALDPVDPVALKKKFADRKDKDIDNDGDSDSSDEYLHKRRKAVSKSIAKEETELDEATVSIYKDMPKEPGKMVSNRVQVKSFKDANAMGAFLGNQNDDSWKETGVAGLKAGRYKIDMSSKDGKPSKNFIKINEEIEGFDEAKNDYTVNHKTFSSAVQHATAQVEKRGYTVDEEDYDRKVAMGPRKPTTGKTNTYTIDLMKDGKETKRKLQMQVYYDQGRYELNMYIS